MIAAWHADPKAGHVLRNAVIEKLVPRTDVDCFGKGVRWIDSKLDGLASYAFSIAIENCNRDFYFSEKIIDCLLTDTVPIYCGCPSIDRYFDPRGMIRFETLPQLEAVLDDLTWDLYKEMLPFVRINRERAIRQKWATRSQMFERVAHLAYEHFGELRRFARPTLFRYAQNARRVIGR